MFKRLWTFIVGDPPVDVPEEEDPLEVERRKPFKAGPFVVEYLSNQGQVATYGDRLRNLPLELESVGGGLEEVEGSSWVPSLARSENGWILCWVKPEKQKRPGAWKARGATLTGNTDRYRQLWPAMWSTLNSNDSNEAVDELKTNVSELKIDQLPELPSELKTVLANAYAKRFKDQQDHIFFTVEAAELQSKISWLWLLGPLDPTKSYLRPVRSNTVWGGNYEGYCPIWKGDHTKEFDRSSLDAADQELFEKYFTSIIGLAKTDIGKALEEIGKLRSKPNFEALRTAMRVYLATEQ